MSDVETALDNVLTADDVFAGNDTEPLRVTIPEWQRNGKPGILWIYQLNAQTRINLTAAVKDAKAAGKSDEGMFLMVIASCFDAKENGKPIFTADHVAKLREKSYIVLDRLQQLALIHNKMMQGQIENAKNGSGETTAPIASPSDLPKS